MDDTFARIGVAFHHLLAQSSVNGPAREEVKRLGDELQTLELHINDIVNERVTASVEGIEGRIMAHVDGNFTKLAEVLEASEIDFTPIDPPPPVVIAPAADPAPVPAADPAPVAEATPMPTTGNIPSAAAEPVVQAEPPAEPEASEADPVLIEADPNAAPIASDTAPTVDLTSDPEQMTVAQATQWLDDHKIDHDGVILRDDLRALVAKTQADAAPQATGAGDTTIMVEGGASDVTE